MTIQASELLLRVRRATSAPPLRSQVEGELRAAIRHGRLPAGARLPSTRLLAADLGVSRRLVVEAFEQLAAEGWLDAHIGSLTPGRAADVLVLERHHDDPYESVCLADPGWVELVLIGGDVAYGRPDWFQTLTAGATGPTVEQLFAWGKPMTLDTGYRSGGTGADDAVPLSTLRSLLTAAYPPVGPIFA